MLPEIKPGISADKAVLLKKTAKVLCKPLKLKRI